MPRVGFEPTTLRSSAGCSPRLSYRGTEARGQEFSLKPFEARVTSKQPAKAAFASPLSI